MIIHSTNFNIRQIADSGQCFRMNKIGDDKYSLVAYGRYIELTQIDSKTVEINCSTDDYELIWKDYFDLEYNYKEIVDRLLQGEDEFLQKAAAFGCGIRIVRQEPFEALISFIISQNKNIPAIRSCIDKICERYGERNIKDENGGICYYAFPTPEALANAKRDELRKTGLGYRDEYVMKAAQAVLKGDIDLNFLNQCSHEEAVNKLKCLCGVGEKVASCVSLYGLHHIEVFPIDVWIARILNDVYDNEFDWGLYKGYAGIVQQYMFYYIRYKE